MRLEIRTIFFWTALLLGCRTGNCCLLSVRRRGKGFKVISIPPRTKFVKLLYWNLAFFTIFWWLCLLFGCITFYAAVANRERSKNCVDFSAPFNPKELKMVSDFQSYFHSKSYHNLNQSLQRINHIQDNYWYNSIQARKSVGPIFAGRTKVFTRFFLR